MPRTAKKVEDKTDNIENSVIEEVTTSKKATEKNEVKDKVVSKPKTSKSTTSKPKTTKKETIEINTEDKEELATGNIVNGINMISDDEIIIIPEKKEIVEEVKPEKVKNSNTNFVRFEGITKDNGLNDDQVNQRILEGNVNQNNNKTTKSIAAIIFGNIFTFFNMLYVFITILLCIAKSWSNLTFLVVVIPNTLLGIIQEIKAKKMVEKLSLVVASKANVIRNGVVQEIDTNDVVIDDVITYTNGNQIYTDSIVMEGSLEVNESMITGESDAILKNPGDFLYSGSFVVSGACYAKVENVGKNNYIEKLATEAKKQKGNKSELLKTLNWIIRVIGIIIIPLFIIQFMRAYGEPLIEWDYTRFQSSIKNVAGSIIGMIPSGLFLLTSIALYTGVSRLGKKNNTLVHELYCIEMLARVDTLCLDKTGTITDGTMRVIDCLEIKNQTDYSIREIVGSMMNAFTDSNATSDALIRFFSKNNVLTPTSILPFSSKRKYSAVTFKDVGTFYLGAPEFILIDNYEKVKAKIERYASQGCRVLALGQTQTGIKKEGIAANVKPIALIVIQDHIREDAYETIEFFRNNGVDVKVISGDNPITVSEIARRAGVANSNRYISLEGLSDEEVKEIAFDYTIFGRVTPNQKKALVEAFKAKKRTVAMTGDGVNDILAMKESDCSIAMASGSEATRNIANLVLMDSNFASMPAVVAEGRRVINNIQRTSTLFLVKTLFTIMLTIFYLSLGKTYPFEPSQLLLIEFFIIGLPATIISLQPNKEQVQGHFILNVLKASLPGALTVLLFHVFIYLTNFGILSIEALPGLVGWSDEIYHTVLLIVTTAITLMVLFRMCKPYNTFKRILFVIVLIVTLLCIVKVDWFSISLFGKQLSLNGLLHLEVLNEVQILFTIVCILIINLVLNSVQELLTKITKIKI